MEQEEKAVAIRDQSTELSVDQIKSQVNLIQQVMADVMTEGHHYGVIPGTDKPTLLKPGAEKLGLTFRLAPEFEETVTDMGNGHREYRFKCRLRHIVTGAVVGEGVGSCSTMESKYRWRNAGRVCPTCGKDAIIKGKEEYGGGWICFKKKDGCGAKFKDDDPGITSQVVGRVENADIADIYNTAYKIAKKRAHIDAMLTATAASDIFTQDLDETIVSHRSDNDGATMLAKLFTVITDALRAKELTPKEFADTALGLDAYLAKHKGENVSDYTRKVEAKLKEKREASKPIGEPVTIKGNPTTEDAEVIDDARSKAGMLDDIGKIADRDNPELEIF